MKVTVTAEGFDPATVELKPTPVLAERVFLHVWPDTQQEALSPSDPRFGYRGGYTASEKPHLLCQVGDPIGWLDTPNTAGDPEQQYDRFAGRAIAPVAAAGVQTSLIPGNHGGEAVVGPGFGVPAGSANPARNAHEALRATADFDRYLAPYTGAGATLWQPGKLTNRVEPVRGCPGWFVAGMEMWPRAEVVDWVVSQIGALPSHARVILNTHMWTEPDGSLSTSNGGYGDMSPAQAWARLAPLRRVAMVTSGHVGTHAESVLGPDGKPAERGTVCFNTTFHAEGWTPVRTVLIEGDRVTSWIVDASDRKVRSVSQHTIAL